MKWPRATLRQVAPPERAEAVFADDDVVWQLSLDQIESQTGRILKKVRARAADAGTSTFTFDAKHVLYSKLRPYLNKVARPDESGLATTELVPLRPVPGLLDADFLTFYLRSDAFVNFANLTVAGAKMPRMIMDRFWEHRIPVPALREQRRIVELLEQADALRRQRAEADALSARILPALIRKMFGDISTNSMGWPVHPMSDFIAFLTSGSRGWAKYYKPTGDLFIRIQNVGRNELLLDDIAFVEAPEDAEALRTRVRPRDVLLSITADLGRSAVIPDSFPNAYINQHLALLRLERISPTYVSALLSSPQMRQRWEMIGRDAVKLGLNFDDIRTFRLPVPPIELQNKFEGQLARTNEIRHQQAKARSDLGTLFQTMLHRAFTGELTARWREAHMKELLAEMEQQARLLNTNATTP